MEKQNWQVVGSHSATKLCRWTKSMLQGKGGCYKHTFYGIASHQCMEHTPNVSCANKCIFCWRNHINPVALDWKFDTDDPEEILEESLRKHYATIEKQCLSPNALEHRKAEARQVRHCALSLVGEPVAYPRIREFLSALHRRRISSFLVTNGQFPKALSTLPQVTQLYLSCDGATAEQLKSVGKPLFKDYWERYMESMDILATRRECTVCRLTLLRGENMAGPAEWAQVLQRARPNFIEVKGVTMAGLFQKTGLGTMNMPTHLEVKDFAQQLCEEMTGYQLACEHEHSNSALVASEAFRSDENWKTWIDFEGFADAMAQGETLSALEYTAATPSWALLGSPSEGFAPTETRQLRARARPKWSEEKELWRQQRPPAASCSYEVR